jgi:hypothetical protein
MRGCPRRTFLRHRVAACNPRHPDVEVDEAPDEVHVLSVADPSENEGCDTEAAIDLDDPLTDRALIDALMQRRVEVLRWVLPHARRVGNGSAHVTWCFHDQLGRGSGRSARAGRGRSDRLRQGPLS